MTTSAGDNDLNQAAAEFEFLAVEAEDAARASLAQRSLNRTLANRWGGCHVFAQEAPWDLLKTGESGPNMLSGEERQYLRWVGSHITDGAVLELGPWLGESSRCILEGIPPEVSLFTFDDFIWRSSWMDPYVADTPELGCPANGESFRAMFETVNAAQLSRMVITECYIEALPENKHLGQLAWDGAEKIELLVVDCGRTLSVNDAWFDLLSPHFIPGRTLVVMQDWRLCRQRPKEYFNQTDLFTAKHRDRLHQVHEVRDGGIASFVYSWS